jgi:GntR family transcriptional regulator
MPKSAPILRIDLAAPTPAYEQIVSGLRAILVSGGFEPGDQLPTVRQLAVDLSVHHNTVAEAYRVLAAEGWLELKRGRGATVLGRAKPAPPAGSREQFQRHLRELVAKAITDGVPDTALASLMTNQAKELVERPMTRNANSEKKTEKK